MCDNTDPHARVPESVTAAHLAAESQSHMMSAAPMTRVLIIYTGGTIGMKHTPRGYMPEPNYLEHKLASMHQFHDPECQDHGSGHVMPVSIYGKRVRWNILEYAPLMDSSNMDMSDWARIAKDIGKHYEAFDSFVILHGTDTMSFSGSALSFMLENLGKTVVLTGSQVPVAEIRNDARENLLGALTIAGHFVIPEVCLYFSNKLFRANRTSKVDAVGYNAFDSPNFPPLAEVGITIQVQWENLHTPNTIARFSVHTDMNQNVGAIRLFPGITAATLRAFLQPPMQGVVLETYGAGNAPDSRADLLRELRAAYERGVVIVNCTQCARGMVSDAYAAGRVLTDVGVVCGADMTAEAALAKLSYLLGKPEHSPERVRNLIKKNLRGELTVLVQMHKFSFEDRGFVAAVARVLDAETSDERKTIANALYPVLLCSAAGRGDLEQLKALMESSRSQAILQLSNYDARTPLHVAAAEGHRDVVEFLLLNGALVHVQDRFGRTPLKDALLAGHDVVCNLLVRAGATLKNAFDDASNELANLICTAAAAGNIILLERLKRYGASLNTKNYDMRSALHVAASYGHLDVCRMLVEAVPSLASAKDRFGNLAIDDARRQGHAAVTDYLNSFGSKNN